MISRVLVDTGPLVALFSKRDKFHTVCTRELLKIEPPLVTSWPVLTEATWLLRGSPAGSSSLMKSLGGGLLSLPDFSEAAAAWLDEFLTKYRKVPAPIADASLVYLAERDNLDVVFTLDRRDFSIYRLAGRRSFHILPELSSGRHR